MPTDPSPAELLLDALARATTPSERLAGGWLRVLPGDAAEHRYATWLTRVASGDAARAEAVLSARGLTPAEFTTGLSEVERTDGEPPDWATDAVAMLLAVAPPPPGTAVPRLGELLGAALPAWFDPEEPWRFHPGFHSWLVEAEAEVRTWAAAHGARLSEATITDLAYGLARRLLDLSGPVLIAQAGPTAPLFDEDPAGVWLRLWLDLPVLARLMAVARRQWHLVTQELIARIGADLPAVVGTDEAGRAPLVTSVVTGAGDQHAEGRGVAVVTLDDGTRLFLKPRNDRVHHVLSALMSATGLDGGDLRLRLPELVDRDDYIWGREVVTGEAEDLGGYFRRAGALLRLMQAVGATDLHHENLVPAPDQPVLVDLETVFGPPMGWAGQSETPDGARTAPLEARMADTAGRTSMLSSPVTGASGLRSADLGGLAGPAEALTPYSVQTLERTPSGPRLVNERVPVVNGAALPRQHGRPVGLAGYEQDLLVGFAEADAAIRAVPQAVTDALAAVAAGPLGTGGSSDEVGRGSSAAPGGPSNSAEPDGTSDSIGAGPQAEVRFVPRATQVYSRLLRTSLAPAVLGDGLDREMVLERLWRAFGTCPTGLLEAEQHAMRELDVPMFTIPFESTDLVSDRGRVIAGVLRSSPAADVARRWAAVAERDDHLDDLRADIFAMAPARQQGRVGEPGPTDGAEAHSSGASTAAPAAPGAPSAAAPPSPAPAAPRRPADTAAQLLAAGDVLADRVLVLGDGSLTWTGLAYEPSRYLWRHRQLSAGLLGDAGVALALLTAATVWDRAPADWRELGHRGLLSAAARCADARPEPDAFTSAAGTLYAVASGARLTGSPELLAAAESLVPAALAPTKERPAVYGIESASAAALALAALPGGTAAYADHLAALLTVPTPTGTIDDPPDRWAGTMPSGAAGVALALRALGRGDSVTADPARLALRDPVGLERPDSAAAPSGHLVRTAGGLVRTAGDAAALAWVPGVAEDFWAANWSPEAPAHVLLECADVARAAARAGAAGPWQDRTLAAADALVARHEATGEWFPELIAPDSRLLSAVHGVAAVVLLGADLRSAPVVPLVRIFG